MAPGSQVWNGTCADFVNAPTSISTSPVATAGEPSGGLAASWDSS